MQLSLFFFLSVSLSVTLTLSACVTLPPCSPDSVEHLAMLCAKNDRENQIPNLLRKYSSDTGRAIIFTSTKQEATSIGLKFKEV